MLKQSFFRLLLLASPFFTLVACQKELKETAPNDDVAVGAARVGDQMKKYTYYGPEVALGSGTVRSFYSMNPAGKPKELGVAITASALQSLPPATGENPAYSFVIPLPSQALQATPYQHILFDWNPNGHEPDPIYGVPHFDFHFYTIPSAEREMIPPYTDATAALFDKAPAAGYLPAGYIPTPGGVPQMGKHWIDPTSPEFNGQPFTKTLIYGTYNGNVIFLEPMITLATLLSGKDYHLSIPQPMVYSPTGTYYPKEYNIYYDQASQMYFVSLTDFKKQ